MPTLLERSEVVKREYEEAQRQHDKAKEEKEKARRTKELKKALQEVLGVTVDPTEPTVTIDGITFTWESNEYGDTLDLVLTCPQCGAIETYAIRHLRDIATYIEGHSHRRQGTCEAPHYTPPTPQQKLLAQAMLAYQSGQSPLKSETRVAVLLESIAASLYRIAEHFTQRE